MAKTRARAAMANALKDIYFNVFILVLVAFINSTIACYWDRRSWLLISVEHSFCSDRQIVLINAGAFTAILVLKEVEPLNNPLM